jgi:hypothetical protein
MAGTSQRPARQVSGVQGEEMIFGPAKVELWSQRADGSVLIGITSATKTIQVQVYPDGKIRVLNNTQSAEFMEGQNGQ